MVTWQYIGTVYADIWESIYSLSKALSSNQTIFNVEIYDIDSCSRTEVENNLQRQWFILCWTTRKP